MAASILTPDQRNAEDPAASQPGNHRGHALRPRLLALLFVAAVAVSWKFAEIDPRLLFDRATLAAVAQFAAQSLPPDISPSFLLVVAQASLLTVATAIAATALSMLLAIPLGMLASVTLWQSGLIASSRGEGPLYRVIAVSSVGVRAVLGFLRAVPDLVWALLFVSAIGLGSLAGTLALAISYAGVLGRVYAELFDAVDPQPLEALLSTGAGRTQIFLRGIWPQALPNLTAYTLYSFECCVRAAAVLGFVGAGGIGYQISLSMRLFEYRQVLTLLMAFIAILTLTDAASRKLRSLLNTGSSTNAPFIAQAPGISPAPLLAREPGLEQAATSGPASSIWMEEVRPPASARLPDALRLRLPSLILACAIALSFYFSGFTSLFTLSGLQTPVDLARFAARLLPPDLSPLFLRSLLLPLMQTISISLLGTLMGIVFGGLVAVTATSRLVFAPRENAGTRSLAGIVVANAIYWSSRLLLSILRSIPELVWALMCIIAIGIGPFAGTIALGLHTTGVLGKLYADTMEEAGSRPVEALRSLGARPLQLLLWAIWPQVKPLLGSYTVLRWDMNLRAATILGLVGGGGLGQVMYNDVQLGFYPRVATLILIIYALVMATDWAGSKLWVATSR